MHDCNINGLKDKNYDSVVCVSKILMLLPGLSFSSRTTLSSSHFPFRTVASDRT